MKKFNFSPQIAGNICTTRRPCRLAVSAPRRRHQMPTDWTWIAERVVMHSETVEDSKNHEVTSNLILFRHLPMPNFMSQNVHRRESSRRIWPAERICRPELGNHTVISIPTHSGHSCQTHCGTIPLAILPRVEVQSEQIKMVNIQLFIFFRSTHAEIYTPKSQCSAFASPAGFKLL